MKKKTLRELVEENRKMILKDKDKVEQIFEKIDENIVLESRKQKIV
ncbi:FbpB family small basic protein [Peribacillus alkalitolerans]|nr:FbpB family small basic protein [Peribacillus alkalitolerans]